MSSSLEAQCLAAETLGSADKAEFGEVTAILDCQSLPLKYRQPIIRVTTRSSRVSAHLIDGHSTVSMLNQDDEELLMDAIYHNSESPTFKEPDTIRKAISSCSQGEDYIGKIKDLQVYLDMVKKIVKPGCSQEMLEVALCSMSDAGASESDDAELSDDTLMALKYLELADQRKDGRKP